MAIDQLKQFYKNRGFFNTEIFNHIYYDSTNYSVNIVLSINEGIRTILDSVIFIGNIIYSDSLFSNIIDVEKSQILDSTLYSKAQSEIENFLTFRGRLFAKIERFFVFDSSGMTADLIFTIAEGPVVKAGDVHIIELNRVDQITIKRELKFKPDEVLTSPKILSSIRELYSTGLFSVVNIYPVDTFPNSSEADSVTAPILVQLEEDNFFDIQFGGGYNSIDKWFGAIELAYKNLFGLGHRISSSIRLSSVVQQGQIDYSYPWLFDKDFTGLLSSYIERRKEQSFTGLYTGGSVALDFDSDIKNKHRFWISYKHTGWIHAETETQEKPNTLLLGSHFSRDIRKSIYDPGNSYYGYIEAELAGPAFSWSNQFYRLKLDIRGYFELWKDNLGLSSAIFAGYIDNYGKSSVIPLAELFRIGIESVRPVRGYTELQVSANNDQGEVTGGKLVTVINLINLRFPVFSFLSGEFFIDGGFTWPEPENFSFDDLKWSSGPGLLISLPASIFRIDYGFKLKWPFEFTGGWYFGIGHAF